MIAALFVEKGGCYYGIPGVDPWDIDRDARLYDGPHPVIAHPPCERWGNFSNGSPTTKDGRFRTGDDNGCFASALESVIRFGGVLEHPANTKAWEEFGLTRPRAGGWTQCLHLWVFHGRNAWVCEVEQGHYGHPARKRTWLLVVSTRPITQLAPEHPPDLVWGKSPQRLPAKRLSERGYESARRCGAVANLSHKQRQQTPIPFRDKLIEIANWTRGE